MVMKTSTRTQNYILTTNHDNVEATALKLTRKRVCKQRSERGSTFDSWLEEGNHVRLLHGRWTKMQRQHSTIHDGRMRRKEKLDRSAVI